MSSKDLKYDDLDDIIGLAEQLKLQDADKLSFEEISKVAKELDIPVEYLQKAITEQKRRKELAEKQKEIPKKRLKQIGIGVGVVAALFLIWF